MAYASRRLAPATSSVVATGSRDALITDVVAAVARGEKVALRSPYAFRPWQHVLQALSGYLTLSVKLLTDDDPRWCDGWNFGPVAGNELPVHRVVEIFSEAFHGRTGASWTDGSDTSNPREANILRLSIDKALWELDWRPQWDVAEVLDHTARWYRLYGQNENPGGHDMQAVTLEQIALYERAFATSVPAQGLAA